VPDRSHLSIGEVLSLLRDEFPDVTISKIRFLESQGLVDPERTPSGYRKFYEHDVERLRWILRQQRENFLPLKVIKGRLTDQDPDETSGTGTGGLEAQPSHGGAPEGGQLFAPAGPSMTGPGAPGTNGLVAVDVPAVGDPSLRSAAPPEAVAHGDSIAAPSGEGRAAADPEGSDPGFAVSPEIAPSEVAVAVPGVAGPGGTDPGVAPSVASAGPLPGGFDPSAASRGALDAAVAPTPGAAPAPDFGGASHAPNRDAARVGARVGGLAAAPVADNDDDQSFSLSELMAGSGLDQAQVAELTGFGLIIPQGSSGGEKYYGPDSLAIATAAAGFARHGVDARHLRAWRTAAEREVSLFEQVVIPLLRQRNPQARAQAAATLSELAHLGSALREILVRRGLDEVH